MNILAIIYGLFFIKIGISHFREPEKFAEIIPPFLPFPIILVYITGAMELLGGIAIIYPETQELGGRFLALSWLGSIQQICTCGHTMSHSMELNLVHKGIFSVYLCNCC